MRQLLVAGILLAWSFANVVHAQDAAGKNLLFAWLRSNLRSYRAPSWLKDKTETVRWRVVAKDQNGKAISESGFRTVRLAKTK